MAKTTVRIMMHAGNTGIAAVPLAARAGGPLRLGILPKLLFRLRHRWAGAASSSDHAPFVFHRFSVPGRLRQGVAGPHDRYGEGETPSALTPPVVEGRRFQPQPAADRSAATLSLTSAPVQDSTEGHETAADPPLPRSPGRQGVTQRDSRSRSGEAPIVLAGQAHNKGSEAPSLEIGRDAVAGGQLVQSNSIPAEIAQPGLIATPESAADLHGGSLAEPRESSAAEALAATIRQPGAAGTGQPLILRAALWNRILRLPLPGRPMISRQAGTQRIGEGASAVRTPERFNTETPSTVSHQERVAPIAPAVVSSPGGDPPPPSQHFSETAGVEAAASASSVPSQLSTPSREAQSFTAADISRSAETGPTIVAPLIRLRRRPMDGTHSAARPLIQSIQSKPADPVQGEPIAPSGGPPRLLVHSETGAKPAVLAAETAASGSQDPAAVSRVAAGRVIHRDRTEGGTQSLLPSLPSLPSLPDEMPRISVRARPAPGRPDTVEESTEDRQVSAAGPITNELPAQTHLEQSMAGLPGAESPVDVRGPGSPQGSPGSTGIRGAGEVIHASRAGTGSRMPSGRYPIAQAVVQASALSQASPGERSSAGVVNARGLVAGTFLQPAGTGRSSASSVRTDAGMRPRQGASGILLLEAMPQRNRTIFAARATGSAIPEAAPLPLVYLTAFPERGSQGGDAVDAGRAIQRQTPVSGEVDNASQRTASVIPGVNPGTPGSLPDAGASRSAAIDEFQMAERVYLLLVQRLQSERERRGN